MAPVRGRTLLLLCAIAAGCSLDFTVRPQPADGGSAMDATRDAEVDSIADAGAEDAAGDVFALWEAGGDGSVDCPALKSDLDLKKTDARKCQTTTQYCQSTVRNECDCEIVVAKPDNTATFTYVDAVAKFKDAGCVIPGYCQVCPSTSAKSCLFQAGVPSCYP